MGKTSASRSSGLSGESRLLEVDFIGDVGERVCRWKGVLVSARSFRRKRCDSLPNPVPVSRLAATDNSSQVFLTCDLTRSNRRSGEARRKGVATKVMIRRERPEARLAVNDESGG